MRWNWKFELPQWVLLAAMSGAGAASWTSAPARIPVHWNLQGEVDRYGGRFEGLLALPLLAIGTYLLLLVLPRFDPRRENYARFAGAYAVIRLSVLAVLGVTYLTILLTLRGVAVDVGAVIGGAVGVLLIVLGLVMPRLQPNWFAGIRTPWTLSSDEVWKRTHEFGGRVFVAMGVATLLTGLLKSPWMFAVMMVVVLGGSVAMTAYSYWLWRSVGPGRAR